MKRLSAIARLGMAGLLALSALAMAPQASAEPRHGLSLFGDLKYPANFKNFDYVNPDAPKGGTVKYAAIGTFDTLNPFQLKGNKESGEGLIFDTLMARSYDEPASEYGLVAESADVADDHRSVPKRGFTMAARSRPRMSSGPSTR
jgi:microcin C transport system substrate-binding protein